MPLRDKVVGFIWLFLIETLLQDIHEILSHGLEALKSAQRSQSSKMAMETMGSSKEATKNSMEARKNSFETMADLMEAKDIIDSTHTKKNSMEATKNSNMTSTDYMESMRNSMETIGEAKETLNREAQGDSIDSGMGDEGDSVSEQVGRNLLFTTTKN
jgi:hypothetical protein